MDRDSLAHRLIGTSAYGIPRVGRWWEGYGDRSLLNFIRTMIISLWWDVRIIRLSPTIPPRTGEITQEYDHHLAPVNTITFVEDNGTKMVTSSDDKKVLVWEWDIGVPIKYISDPTMHSMPVITMHPSERYLVCQSLDNHSGIKRGIDTPSNVRRRWGDTTSPVMRAILPF